MKIHNYIKGISYVIELVTCVQMVVGSRLGRSFFFLVLCRRSVSLYFKIIRVFKSSVFRRSVSVHRYMTLY
jgi:hypothetical protein